jgi:hypothetical protein
VKESCIFGVGWVGWLVGLVGWVVEGVVDWIE